MTISNIETWHLLKLCCNGGNILIIAYNPELMTESVNRSNEIILWIVSDDKDIATITAEFEKMPSLYIADGHHRSAAAALVGAEKAKNNPHHTGQEEYNYFMAVCFQASQLTILDYNRVVKDLNGLTSEQFLDALTKNFEVIEIDAININVSGDDEGIPCYEKMELQEAIDKFGLDILKPAALHFTTIYTALQFTKSTETTHKIDTLVRA